MGQRGQRDSSVIFLKNYTSEVPVSQTISRIEQTLIKCGVTGIMKEYGPGGKVTAIVFQVPIEGDRKLHIRLPADEERAVDALWQNYAGEDLMDNGQLKWG